MSHPIFLSIEKNGKTLHLLKSGSKPSMGERKRKKIPILGSFGQYKDSKSKAMVQSAQSAPITTLPTTQPAAQPRPGQSSILNFAGSAT